MINIQGSHLSESVQCAPLSRSFYQVYSEWLKWFSKVQESGLDAEQVASDAVEKAIALAHRLSRTVFAQLGAVGEDDIAKVQYLFVVLIDEKMLFSSWPGQNLWQNTPLEYRLFSSRTAGEKIPDQIEKLLKERDPAQRDLANVYLQCLALGFYGHSRGEGGLVKHEQWQHELFAFAHQCSADYSDIAVRLEKPCAVTPQRLSVRRMLPDGFRLTMLILATILGMVLIGHLFWIDIVANVEPMLVRQSSALPGGGQ